LFHVFGFQTGKDGFLNQIEDDGVGSKTIRKKDRGGLDPDGPDRTIFTGYRQETIII
jgi:hypothetical protein